MTRRGLFAAFALAALTSTPVLAQQPPVTAQNAWARATPPGASTAAVYMTLTSHSADKLMAVSTPAASKAAVHEMSMEGNVMRMRPVEGGLDLPAGKQVKLAPGGYHVMLEGLEGPLKAGQELPVHLTFQNAPPLDVEAHVRPIGASGPGDGGKDHGAMPGMTMSK